MYKYVLFLAILLLQGNAQGMPPSTDPQQNRIVLALGSQKSSYKTLMMQQGFETAGLAAITLGTYFLQPSWINRTVYCTSLIAALWRLSAFISTLSHFRLSAQNLNIAYVHAGRIN